MERVNITIGPLSFDHADYTPIATCSTCMSARPSQPRARRRQRPRRPLCARNQPHRWLDVLGARHVLDRDGILRLRFPRP